MKKNSILFARKENRRIFTPVITTKANKMKAFTAHETLENQDLRVEINYGGLVRITEKEEGTSQIKYSKPADAISYWNNYFNEESKRGNHQVR